jgi:hypothetical protein
VVAPGLDAFRVARFTVALEAKDRLCLPEYKGSTLRGGFGHVFRKIACVVRRGECPPCLLKGACPYAYIFETPPPADSLILRKYPYAPHPFVLEPPLDAITIYEPGSVLTFGLVLIGKGIDYLPYFIYAFDELGRTGLGRAKGKYTLVHVHGQDGGPHNGRPIYDSRSGILQNGFSVLNGRDLQAPVPEPRRLRIEFLTPTRFKFDSRLANTLEFHILIRNLLRRLSTLCYFHCGQRLELDFRGLVERAKHVPKVESRLRWVDWKRYSARQKRTMLMGGLVGSVTFEGPLAEFLPLLQLGEWVHVGKGTVMGLGQYRIENGDELP